MRGFFRRRSFFARPRRDGPRGRPPRPTRGLARVRAADGRFVDGPGPGWAGRSPPRRDDGRFCFSARSSDTPAPRSPGAWLDLNPKPGEQLLRGVAFGRRWREALGRTLCVARLAAETRRGRGRDSARRRRAEGFSRSRRPLGELAEDRGAAEYFVAADAARLAPRADARARRKVRGRGGARALRGRAGDERGVAPRGRRRRRRRRGGARRGDVARGLAGGPGVAVRVRIAAREARARAGSGARRARRRRPLAIRWDALWSGLLATLGAIARERGRRGGDARRRARRRADFKFSRLRPRQAPRRVRRRGGRRAAPRAHRASRGRVRTPRRARGEERVAVGGSGGTSAGDRRATVPGARFANARCRVLERVRVDNSGPRLDPRRRDARARDDGPSADDGQAGRGLGARDDDRGEGGEREGSVRAAAAAAAAATTRRWSRPPRRARARGRDVGAVQRGARDRAGRTETEDGRRSERGWVVSRSGRRAGGGPGGERAGCVVHKIATCVTIRRSDRRSRSSVAPAMMTQYGGPFDTPESPRIARISSDRAVEVCRSCLPLLDAPSVTHTPARRARRDACASAPRESRCRALRSPRARTESARSGRGGARARRTAPGRKTKAPASALWIAREIQPGRRATRPS